MAFLSSGGILRCEKLEDASRQALRGPLPAPGQNPVLSGMNLCLCKGVCAAMRACFRFICTCIFLGVWDDLIDAALWKCYCGVQDDFSLLYVLCKRKKSVAR